MGASFDPHGQAEAEHAAHNMSRQVLIVLTLRDKGPGRRVGPDGFPIVSLLDHLAAGA